MAARQRTMLIVEDSSDFRAILQMGCSLAFKEFTRLLSQIRRDAAEEGLYVLNAPVSEPKLLQAADEPTARQILASHSDLDFVSVDLALAANEYANSNIDSIPAAGVGGLRLLNQLVTTNQRTLAMVISGEKQQEYSIQATLEYKVIHYRHKSRFDLTEYIRIVTAALLYQESLDYLSDVEKLNIDPDNLELAQRCWKRANQVVAEDAAAKLRKINLNFPENLGLRMQVIAGDLDRTSKLPTGDWIERALKSWVIDKSGWIVLRAQLADFDTFRSAYTDQVDALRFVVAGAIKSALKQAGVVDAFVGVVSPEYLPEPSFIIFLHAADESRVQSIKTTIIDNYHANNVQLLPYHVRDAFIKRRAQELRDMSPQALPKKPQVELQLLLPQIQFTSWSSHDQEDSDRFPDVREAIHTLTHPKFATQPETTNG